jgi:hypothetical protein
VDKHGYESIKLYFKPKEWIEVKERARLHKYNNIGRYFRYAEEHFHEAEVIKRAKAGELRKQLEELEGRK